MLTRILASILIFMEATSQAAIVSRIYNFTDGSILTASQLNTEFNNLVNGMNSLDQTNFVPSANFSPLQINASIAGSAIDRDTGTGALSVSVDDVTIEVSSNELRVKDGAITQAKLASDVLPPGIMMDYGGIVAPTGWFLCNGQAVSRTTYAALFAVINTSYGAGNGTTTFNVPDFRGRTAVGSGTGSGLTTRANGDSFGEETHLLITNEMPGHSHTINDPGHTHTYNAGSTAGGSGNFGFNRNGNNEFSPSGAISPAFVGITINSSGGGAAHNNLQPSLVATKIIKQ